MRIEFTKCLENVSLEFRPIVTMEHDGVTSEGEMMMEFSSNNFRLFSLDRFTPDQSGEMMMEFSSNNCRRFAHNRFTPHQSGEVIFANKKPFVFNIIDCHSVGAIVDEIDLNTVPKAVG